MKIPKVRFFNYKADFRSWAIVLSVTVSNFAIQLGPFYLYVGWSPLDHALF